MMKNSDADSAGRSISFCRVSTGIADPAVPVLFAALQPSEFGQHFMGVRHAGRPARAGPAACCGGAHA